MDLSNYRNRKQNNKVTLSKVGKDTALVISKRFDPSTGEETEPQQVTVHKQQLLNMKSELEAKLAEVNALLTDVTNETK